MHLNCSPKVLRIEGADFGESSASICTKGEVSSQRCNLVEVTNILKTACDNKKNCWITALDHIFGDPCKGVNVSKQRSSSVYLNVMFACGKQISPLSLPWVDLEREIGSLSSSFFDKKMIFSASLCSRIIYCRHRANMTHSPSYIFVVLCPWSKVIAY